MSEDVYERYKSENVTSIRKAATKKRATEIVKKVKAQKGNPALIWLGSSFVFSCLWLWGTFVFLLNSFVKGFGKALSERLISVIILIVIGVVSCKQFSQKTEVSEVIPKAKVEVVTEEVGYLERAIRWSNCTLGLPFCDTEEELEKAFDRLPIVPDFQKVPDTSEEQSEGVIGNIPEEEVIESPFVEGWTKEISVK